MIRVLIAEDEPPARARIRKLLDARGDCTIVAECPDGRSALDALLVEAVDVLFLDIQMPLLNGFEVLAALPDTVRRPAIIFTTAYDQHALKAFDAAAIDYLLKPWTPARFHSALDRAIAADTAPADPSLAQNKPDALRELLRQASRNANLRIPVRDGDNIHFVRARTIDHIESAGNYLVIHAGGQSHIHRETMTAIDKRLAPLGFFRANRSSLVNLARIREVSAPSGSSVRIILEDDSTINLTRPIRELQSALDSIDG